MRVPVRARRCSLICPASTEGKKSWPSHGASTATDTMQTPRNASVKALRWRRAPSSIRRYAMRNRSNRSSNPRWNREKNPVALVVHGVGLQQELRHRRHDRARQEVGRQHREHDRLGQRDEQVPRHARQEEHRHEDDADRERRDEGRHRDLRRAVQDGLLGLLALLEVAVDVLDLDRGVVHEDADGEREPAERHDVDRLAERREHQQRAEDRERDRHRDDHRAAPAAEEDQDHQPRQAAPR